MPGESSWPALPYESWKETCAAMQLWTQIVGKIRLVQTPWLNHSWHVTLYVNARGLTTSPIAHGTRTFEICFDLIDHELQIATSDGDVRAIKLESQSVASFHRKVMDALDALAIPVRINNHPNEIPDVIPFTKDHAVRPYDAVFAHRFWLALFRADRVFKQFRTGFLGKCSPVHFFWGGFDLAVTRFSGREAPRHPGGVPNLPDAIAQEAYSHEVCSAGFWPGGAGIEYPAFYSYVYPEPSGYREAAVRPDGAFFKAEMGEYVLPYDLVRTSGDSDATLLAFLRSTYEAAAVAAGWDRARLECPEGRPGVPRRLG